MNRFYLINTSLLTGLLLTVISSFGASTAQASGTQIKYSPNSTMCLGIQGSGLGAYAQLIACSASDPTQSWTMVTESSSYGTGYFIRNNSTNLCLVPQDGSTGAGIKMTQAACGNAGSTEMVFKLTAVGSAYNIVNVRDGFCMDLPAGTVKPGALLQQVTCKTGATSEDWLLAAVTATPSPSPSPTVKASPSPTPTATATATPNPLPAKDAYTLTAPHLTMHVGDVVPPCIIEVTDSAGAQVGAGGAYFKGTASCSIGATSSSGAGSYTITVGKGTLTPFNSASTLTAVNGTIQVVAASAIGAKLTNGIVYPPGFLSGPRNTAINVTNNGIANLVGDCKTDNAAAIERLLNFGRVTATATVDVSGTTVTYVSGEEFTGVVAGGTVTVAGVPYIIASTPTATSMTLKTAPLAGSNLTLGFPPAVVNISGTDVTWVNGTDFTWLVKYLSSGESIIVDYVPYKIASIATDEKHMVLTAAAPTVTNYTMYEGSNGTNQVGIQNAAFYFPPGCYATSQPIFQSGAFWTYFGSGPQTSYFYLLPNSPQFQKLVENNGTEFFNPQAVGGNDNFHEFVYNMGFRIGVGNPAAIAFTSEQNNVGAMRNVQIWSDDSNTFAGLYFTRAWAGPAYFKNIAIYGFNSAVLAGQFEMLNTLEDVTTEGQTKYGFNIVNMKLSIRHWLNDSKSPALTLSGANTGLIALLDSQFVNGSSANAGMTVGPGASLYVKNLASSGFSPTLQDNSLPTPESVNGNISQHWSDTAQSLFDGADAPNSLQLPEEETPQASDPAVSTWTKLGSDPTQWNAEIAAGTSSTVYVPPGQYLASGTVPTINLPATVNHLQFYNAMRGAAGYTITFDVEGTSSDEPLIIDGCMYESCIINHLTSRTLVINDTTGNLYNAQVGSGNLFLEDDGLSTMAVPLTFYSSQKVWARQLNEEQKEADKVDCVGCTLWVLGYKTEQDTLDLSLTEGAKAEIFGFFNYQLSVPTAAQSMNFSLTDSSVFLTGWTEVDVTNFGAPNFVTETQKGVKKSLVNSEHSTNYILPMFYSFGASGYTP